MGRKNESGMSSSSSSSGNTRGGNTPGIQLSTRQARAVELAKRQLNFDKGYAEISSNHWSYANMSNQRMVDAMNATSDRYSYEYRKETSRGNLFTNGAPVIHHRIYRNRK